MNKYGCLKNLRNLTKNKCGVSEVTGTLLLISIGISLFSILALLVINASFSFNSNAAPSVYLFGTIDAEKIVLEHYGGDALSPDTQLFFIIGENHIPLKTVEECWMGSYEDEDGRWGFGEKVEYTPDTELFIKTARVQVIIVDVFSNAVVLNSIIQEGLSDVNPYCITEDIPSESITTTSATFVMSYDFKQVPTDATRKIYFKYKIQGFENEYTVPTLMHDLPEGAPSIGSYSYDFNQGDLVAGTTYSVTAYIYYTLDGTPYPPIPAKTSKIFTTLSYKLGEWHFNEGTGMIAEDVSSYRNNFSLFAGYESYPPDWRLTEGVINSMPPCSLAFDGYNDFGITGDFVNSESNQFTFEGWVKPLDRCNGTIGVLEKVDVSQFIEQSLGFCENDIILINAIDDYAYYACVSRLEKQTNPIIFPKGFLSIIKIFNDGSIYSDPTDSFIDLYKFEDVNCYSPRIMQVAVDGVLKVYAIVYTGPNSYGYIKTVAINSETGEIDDGAGDPIRATYVFDPPNYRFCYNPDIIKIAGSDDIYGIAYSNRGNCGYLQTVQISDVGNEIILKAWYNFSVELIGNFRFMRLCNITHVVDNRYVIFFQDGDNDLSYRRVKILSDGGIDPDFGSGDRVDWIDPTGGYSLKVLKVSQIDDNYLYVISYGIINPDNPTAGQRGKVATLLFNNQGEFSSIMDFETIEPSYGAYNNPKIFYLSTNEGLKIYLICYRSVQGTIRLFTVNPTNGDIAYNLVNTYVFTETPSEHKTDWYVPFFLAGSSDKIALFYQSYYASQDINNGRIKTFEFTITPDIPTISFNELDQRYIGADNCFYPNILPVVYEDDFTICALLYTAEYSKGVLKTIKINSDGSINPTILDRFDDFMDIFVSTSSTVQASIHHLKGDLYGVSYQDSNQDLIIELVTIDSISGQITTTGTYITIDTEKPPGQQVKLIPAGNDLYMLLYLSLLPSGDPELFIQTLFIPEEGSSIESKQLRTLSDLENPLDYDAIYVDGDEQYSKFLFISSSTKSFLPTQLVQIQIDSSKPGDIQILTTLGDIDLFFPVDDINITRLSNGIHDNMFLVSSYSSFGIIFLHTLYLETVPEYSLTILDFTYRVVNQKSLRILHFSDDIYILSSQLDVYSGSDVISETFRISENGNISAGSDILLEMTNRLVIDFSRNVSDAQPRIIPVVNDIYAVFYQGIFYDGYIETIKITPTKNKRTIIDIPSVLQIIADDTEVSATLTNRDSIQQTLTLPIYQGLWNFLVVNYTGSELYFKNFYDATSCDEGDVIFSGNINVKKNNDILIGMYNAIYDEFLVHSRNLSFVEIQSRFDQLFPGG